MKNVVVIGGGTGQSVILKGLKNVPNIEITTIVTVADDGGSTGRLRKQFHIPAMGDIRNVMCALAEEETLFTHLMEYRFKGENDDEQTGINIVARAIEEPLRTIAENAGVEGSVIIQKVKEGKDDFGYNARTDRYENLIAAGVIDPTKVARVALENAASVAGMFLTTECVIADKKEEMPPMAMPQMGGGMGGMM